MAILGIVVVILSSLVVAVANTAWGVMLLVGILHNEGWPVPPMDFQTSLGIALVLFLMAFIGQFIQQSMKAVRSE